MDRICEYSDSMINIVKQAYSILSQKCSRREKEKWVKHINKNLRICNHVISNENLSVASLNKLHTNIGHLKRFKLSINEIDLPKHNEKKRSSRVRWLDINAAFASRVRSGVIINLKHKDPTKFLKDAFYLFKTRINRILKEFPIIKVNTCFCGEFIKSGKDRETIEYKYFNTPNFIIDRGTDLENDFKQNVIDKILNKLEHFQERDSGFSLQKVLSLDVNINKYELGILGSSYIPLPAEISNKKACVNVLNKDNACFYWAVTSFLHPPVKKGYANRISSYPHYTNVLNLTGLDIPISLSQISKFETLNNISVNVFGLELDDNLKYTTVPFRITKYKDSNRPHVNLLMIQNIYFSKNSREPFNGKEVEVKYHFCWIKSLSRLISQQLNKHNNSKFICERCLNYFNNVQSLESHTNICEQFNDCKVSFSNEKFIKFKNHVYQQTIPFILYCDFETMLSKFVETKTTSNHTKRYQKHIPISAGYYLVCNFDDKLNVFKSYTGLNCIEWFLDRLEELATYIESKIHHVVPVETSNFDRSEADKCHICNETFSDNGVICLDHNHFTGKARGWAHRKCNILFRKLYVVPVCFHNLSEFDSHFLIKELAKRGSVSLLPINKERYISFTKYNRHSKIRFRFIDTFRFLNSSLDKLVSLLNKDQMMHLRSEFSELNEEGFSLVTRKGVVPYEYIDSLEKLNETKFPDAELFYNKLNDSEISEVDYKHAEKVWSYFNIRNLREFFDLYLKTDILQLADVFENFRKMCYNIYGLDPAFYHTLPGYTWDCMLKYTGCILETIQDVDMLMFFEKGIRGGISQCCNRFSEANNKYMPNYKQNLESKFINYFDINSLYGAAMQVNLAYGNFEWIDDINFNVMNISDDGPEGYILEVDLEYCEILHDLHKDLPFCCEHLKPPNSKIIKLMTTLHDKHNYVIHYRALKQCLEAGLRIKKIHKILKFSQSAWLKPYIDLNTRLRSEATDEFSYQLFKLLINAIYGKCMENVRKYRIVKLVNKWNGRCGAKYLISSPNFHSRTIFEENLMAIEMKKTNIVFDKPLYVGMCILDISKTFLYDFHYNYMMKKFDIDHCKLLYTDTDSLIYELKCDDVYRDVIKADIHKFDTSEYPENNQYNIPQVNKKVIGLMKDEACGSIITHFIGLRSKQYTFVIQATEKDKQKCVKRAKGIKRHVVKQNITFDDYLKCLQEKEEISKTQSLIQSIKHNVYTVEETKTALNPFDDKRYLLENSTDTLPFGHYSILY